MIFYNENDMIILADGGTEIMVTVETIVQAGLILFIGIAIIVANILALVTLMFASEPRDPMIYYLLSLAVADLLCGALVVPLSVYPTVVHDWIYGDTVCRFEGYLEVTLWTVSVYMIMWIGVDRYLAIRKPMRYETLQTKTRCQCWIVFSWVTAALLCSPPLLDFSKPTYYRDAHICMLDWSQIVPYSVTLACLVLAPSLMTIGYTYAFVFAAVRRSRRSPVPHDKEYAALGDNTTNPYHSMSFTLLVLFWLSWLPFIAIHLYELTTGNSFGSPTLHFGVTWLGIVNSFWKPLVYIFMSAQFRTSLRSLCATVCCRWKGRRELIICG